MNGFLNLFDKDFLRGLPVNEVLAVSDILTALTTLTAIFLAVWRFLTRQHEKNILKELKKIRQFQKEFENFDKEFVKYTKPTFTTYRFKDEEGEMSVNFDDLLKYVTDEKDLSRVLMIHAEAGMGKSRLLRFLAYLLLCRSKKDKNDKSDKGQGNYLPLISCGIYYTEFINYLKIDELIEEIKKKKSDRVEIKYLLLDGFDECREYFTGEFSAEDILKRFFSELNKITDDIGISRVIITSRMDMLKSRFDALKSLKIETWEAGKLRRQSVDVVKMNYFTDKQVMDRYKIKAKLTKPKEQSKIAKNLKKHLEKYPLEDKNKKSILRIPFFIEYVNDLFIDTNSNALDNLTREAALSEIVNNSIDKEYWRYKKVKEIKSEDYIAEMKSVLGKIAFVMNKEDLLDLPYKEYNDIPCKYKVGKERLLMVRVSKNDQDYFRFQYSLFKDFFLVHFIIENLLANNNNIAMPLDRHRKILGFYDTGEEYELKKRLYAYLLKEKGYKEAIERNIESFSIGNEQHTITQSEVYRLLNAKKITIVTEPIWNINRILLLLPLTKSLHYRKYQIDGYEELKDYVDDHFLILNPEAFHDTSGVAQFGKLVELDATEGKIEKDAFENFFENFNGVDVFRITIKNAEDLRELINAKISKIIKMYMKIRPTDVPEFVQMLFDSNLDKQRFSFLNGIGVELFLNALLHIGFDDTKYSSFYEKIKSILRTVDSETAKVFGLVEEKLLSKMGINESTENISEIVLFKFLSDPDYIATMANMDNYNTTVENMTKRLYSIEGSDYEIQDVLKKRLNFIEQLNFIGEEYLVCEINVMLRITPVFVNQFKQYPKQSEKYLCELLQKRTEYYGKNHPYTENLQTLFTESQCQLGVCYYYGDGVVDKDPAQAVYWFQKAAEQDYEDAQYLLGVCYYCGNGVDKDFAQAVYWFQKAAEQDHEYAQYWLGECYYNGDGVVDKDPAQAVYWFQKAADHDHEDAQCWLGKCYYNGDGVDKDPAQAIYWFQKAAEQGNTEALEYLETAELCLEAVKNNGLALESVPENLKTHELCLEAVKQSGWALEHVPENLKTHELCLEAVKQSGWALEYVPENLRTAELCLEAVKQSGWALEHVPEKLKTPKLCLEAVKQNDELLNYVPEALKANVKKNAKKYVPENLKTAELCLDAVKQNGLVLEHVPENFKNAKLCLEAVKQSGWALEYVPGKLKTAELCFEAVKQSGWALEYVPEKFKTTKLRLEAIKQNNELLDYAPEVLKTNIKNTYQLSPTNPILPFLKKQTISCPNLLNSHPNDKLPCHL